MPYVICDPCIGTKDACGGRCADVCPADCIHPTRSEANFACEPQVYVNRADCIDCEACVQECDPMAILPDSIAPQDCILKNDDYYGRPHDPCRTPGGGTGT